jgi:hypothetical protein
MPLNHFLCWKLHLSQNYFLCRGLRTHDVTESFSLSRTTVHTPLNHDLCRELSTQLNHFLCRELLTPMIHFLSRKTTYATEYYLSNVSSSPWYSTACLLRYRHHRFPPGRYK